MDKANGHNGNRLLANMNERGDECRDDNCERAWR